jgi:hypothetical protein
MGGIEEEAHRRGGGVGELSLINKLQEVFILRRGRGEGEQGSNMPLLSLVGPPQNLDIGILSACNDTRE